MASLVNKFTVISYWYYQARAVTNTSRDALIWSCNSTVTFSEGILIWRASRPFQRPISNISTSWHLCLISQLLSSVFSKPVLSTRHFCTAVPIHGISLFLCSFHFPGIFLMIPVAICWVKSYIPIWICQIYWNISQINMSQLLNVKFKRFIVWFL